MADDWAVEESPVVVGPEVQDIKLFGKWSADEVQVADISLTVCMPLYHPLIFGFLCKGTKICLT